MTPKAFYGSQIFERKRDSILFNPLLYACILSQQFSVDQYVKVEAHRLQYILDHQTDLRAESYTVLRALLGDAAGLRDELNAIRLGKMFVLPSTFSVVIDTCEMHCTTCSP